MQDWADLAADLLPPVLQSFVRLIGLPATMAMVESYGGLRIYIPKEPTAEHEFSRLIGLDNLSKLSAVLGGLNHFQLPKAELALKAIRNAKIYSERSIKSNRDFAIEYGLTERQITRIMALRPQDGDTSSQDDAPATEGQADMFGGWQQLKACGF